MSLFAERPVVDMTGIAGQYNMDLTFAPETTQGLSPVDRPATDPRGAAEPGPSLFEAVRQYGLQLDARKAPLELLTVTHAEKTPTEN